MLIGSDLIETGRWRTERLPEKGVNSAHIGEERPGRAYEMFDQFIARAWRLTSPRPVSVYVALTLGSLDPKKWELRCQKAKAAYLALDGQMVDEPEQPISHEEFLRELRKQGVKPTGEEMDESDIRSAWDAQAVLARPARLRLLFTASEHEQITVDWHRAPIEEPEQLDLSVAA